MRELTILDGGMGQELTQRLQTRGGLWSAQALVDAPQVVAQIHREFIEAGADTILTNTYSTIPSYLAKAGLADQYLHYAQLAGEIAREVADAFDAPIRVMASIPPLQESYRHDLVPADNPSREVYESLVATLAPYVDGFVCETMSCVRESVNAASAVRTVSEDKALWVAWTLDETPGQGLRSGESVAAAYDAIVEFNVQALLFNCTSPAAISAGLQELATLTDMPIGAYPNLLTIPPEWTLDSDRAAERGEMSAEEFIDYALKWRDLGASIIGGCCGFGPGHIQALTNAKRSGALV